jgi:hypothetical protein
MYGGSTRRNVSGRFQPAGGRRLNRFSFEAEFLKNSYSDAYSRPVGFINEPIAAASPNSVTLLEAILSR